MDKNTEQNYKTLESDKNNLGEVQISEEVVASIAGLAALEVEGVSQMVGSMANEIADKLGVKNHGKGIKADINNNDVIIDINISMAVGHNVLTTCKAVQDRVKQSVESMTGLCCKEVNVCVAGVTTEN
ncbi:MAG: Asp23/Gls24 family envelope stress response protein [Lachnospiraceae bacterium]|nr:Asp23/Gls24 family envelope stress response protein [Lachnospiraceae bacterium]